MSLKLKLILWAIGFLGVFGALTYGLYRFGDWCADAREASVRLEWADEKQQLTQARDDARKEAADRRDKAEGEKQENTQHGENVIEKARNIDPDWGGTHMPAELYQSARQN